MILCVRLVLQLDQILQNTPVQLLREKNIKANKNTAIIIRLNISDNEH